jgi:beta-galactosidase
MHHFHFPPVCFHFLHGQREEIKLGGDGWRLWLDREAQWEHDPLFLPGEFVISELPRNPPSGGWQVLTEDRGVSCRIPATVEEYFSGGDPMFTYHGVSWFWKEVVIPEDWAGKKIQIRFEETRLRAELYVNRQLAGYDLVAETTWQADLSRFLLPGEVNLLAVRITNAGGHRGWEDMPEFRWGSYEFPSSHDFGGIGGQVTLIATEIIHIEDVFIQNLLPANERNIKIQTSISNKTDVDSEVRVRINIEEPESARILYSTEYQTTARAGMISESDIAFSVPEAKIWDVKTPELYICRVNISSNLLEDEITERFGFRVFEVKHSDGMDVFYLNNKRLRVISGLDWGYYAGTGLYATDTMAIKSVRHALDIGHNAISFHRCIGEPSVMRYADEAGLLIYEEPGGFHAGQQGYNIEDNTFMGDIMYEKSRRMVLRDRNHPSLIMINLCNEDNYWNTLRERVMRMISEHNPSVMVSNSSGGYIFDIFQLTPSNFINHIRPYESQIRDDFEDNHTVEETGGVFSDAFLFSHPYETSNLMFWGEVHCYGGPDNWFKTAREMQDTPSWDINYFLPMHDKIQEYFSSNDLPNTGSRVIQKPDDVSRQAGRGLMYINGRAVQNLLGKNSVDGLAINGYTGTSQVLLGAGGYWSSAILDSGRNIKGVASDYAYWTRNAQISIKRVNGQVFEPEQIGIFELVLINHHILDKGSYLLQLSISDGKGIHTSFKAEMPVQVKGGDVFSQFIANVPIKFRNWNGGYITIEAELKQDGVVVAEGAEQVLLRNRASFNSTIGKYAGSVYQWPAAEKAIMDARFPVEEFDPGMQPLSYICAGALPKDRMLEEMLKRVESDGTTLLISFNEEWAKALFDKGLLSEMPEFDDCRIIGGWAGNGWGYIDYFPGDQAIPGKSTIGTNSWELGGLSLKNVQQGFWPFRSKFQTRAYGAHLARPDIMLVMIGELEYGKGRILLDAAYTIDQDHPFTDLLFYNKIGLGSQHVNTSLLQARTPFHLEPQPIPGLIQAEDYDIGAEGVTYHDKDDANMGGEYRNDGVDISSLLDLWLFVGWTEKGEWLEYSVDVKRGGTYSVEFHYASPYEGGISLFFDGANRTGNIHLPPTGDYHAFRPHHAMVRLDPGVQIMRLQFNEGGINLNSIHFTFLE